MIIDIDIDICECSDDVTYRLGTVRVVLKRVDGELDEWVAARFAEWRAEVEHPDADSQFVKWLCEKYGCTEVPGNHRVIIRP